MYESFYNLRCKPFQLNTDPEFFFQSAIHKSAILYMRYGLMQGEGFVVVTGIPGLGKTMLVKELVNTLDSDDILIGVMVSSQVDPIDTLRVISSAFGLPFMDLNKATLLANIEQLIKTTSDNGQRLLLIVDEAQNLPKQSLEELRMLSNFERDGKIVFQTFLVGQQELRNTIFARDMDQFKQRIVSAFQLKPLDAEQTKEYIIFRLTKANWDHKPEFIDDAFKRIYEFTSGIPRKINTLCDRILFFGFAAELDIIDLESVNKVINELEEEMMEVETVGGAADNDVVLPTPTLPISETSGSVEDRVANLERKLATLQASHNKERELLRKSILIQLDMDDINV